MPRKARILVPNCLHHIVQSSHNRKVVFVSDEDHQYYLENLKEWKTRLCIELYVCYFMTNHVHLIVELGEDVRMVSEQMTRLAGRQAAFVNKQENRSGALWEGRFEASPIQRDNYLLACCRYVEMNPVRVGMISGPWQYHWSSYRERFGQANRGLLDMNVSFLGLADNETLCIERPRAYLKQGASDRKIAMLCTAWARNQLTGNERFVDAMGQRMGLRVEHRGSGRPRIGENRK